MTALTIINLIVMFFLILIFIRIRMVNRIRWKAWDISTINAEQALKGMGKLSSWQSNWEKSWEGYTKYTNYRNMVFFQLHKWTFKQFYPNLK